MSDVIILARAFSNCVRCRNFHNIQRLSSPRSHSRIFFSSFSDGENTTAGKKRVVFLGTPEVAAQCLRDIYKDSMKGGSPYELVSVITQPPKRRTRKSKITHTPVGLVADELGIPILFPEKARDASFLDDLENNVRPDLCITAAYGQYLPKRFLATPTYGTVNIHPSILPRWRGASPVQRSLEAGDNPVGVSVLFTVSKMDAGPIIVQEETEIGKDDQATTVLPLLFNIGTNRLIKILPDILNGSITTETARDQDESIVKEASKIKTEEAELKLWEESALTCHNRMRGFSMWPGTFLYLQLDDEKPMRVKIAKARVLDEVTEPTQVIEKGPGKKDGLRFVCADGSILEVPRLQPTTRNEMDAKSFVNGLQGRTARWVIPAVKS